MAYAKHTDVKIYDIMYAVKTFYDVVLHFCAL